MRILAYDGVRKARGIEGVRRMLALRLVEFSMLAGIHGDSSESVKGLILARKMLTTSARGLEDLIKIIHDPSIVEEIGHELPSWLKRVKTCRENIISVKLKHLVIYNPVYICSERGVQIA